jgi:hypothetical protein
MAKVVFAAVPQLRGKNFGTRVVVSSGHKRQIGNEMVEERPIIPVFAVGNGIMVIDNDETDEGKLSVKELTKYVENHNVKGQPLMFVGPFRDDPADKKDGMTAEAKAHIAQEENRELTAEERAVRLEVQNAETKRGSELKDKEIERLKAELARRTPHT